MANKEWKELFSGATCTALAAVKSDHSPLYINKQVPNQGRKMWSLGFRYEAAWDLHEDCHNIVANGWKSTRSAGASGCTMRHKLETCPKALQQWRKRTQQENHNPNAETLQRISHLQNTRNGSHASQRRRTNTVRSVEDQQGTVVAAQAGIGEVFTSYFSTLFSTSCPTGFDECFHAMESKLTVDMKSWLSKPFTREEVRGVVFQMNPLGSPGPDGFPAHFYQKHWEVVGEEVYSYALEVLNWSRSLQDVNDTYISLIPKVKKPKKVAEFRPISLCNVLYKIVSKTLANRMKGILHNLISLNPSAFVPGRLISDNKLVAYEVLNSMNSRMKGKRGCMALKIDMSKAYDKIEWSFVEAVMVKMEFPLRWIRLIQSCLNSIFYSILVSGEPQRKFMPSWGLRQGDPVSPYIFNMCAEALTSLLKRVEQVGQIIPVPVGRGPITVNHLERSPLKGSVTGHSHLCNGDFPDAKLDYKQVEPTYQKIWWGYNEDTSKIQWVRWNQLNYSKEAGGLGFRDFRSFNLALLAKQGWRILENPSSLAAMVLKQKYFSKSGLLDATLGSRPSFAWRGVCAGLEILREGLVWRVGNGHKINIWKDWWITSFPSKKVTSTRPVGCECEQDLLSAQEYEAVRTIPLSVGGMEDRMVWHFTTNGQYSVKSGYHVYRQMKADLQGESYRRTQVKYVWKSIWKLKTTPSVKQFVWRACNGALPTLANLKRRKIVEESSCFICTQATETSSHALWSCVVAQDVWKQSCRKVQKMSCHSDLFFDIWSILVENLDVVELEETAIILKRIWTRRNELYHGKGFTHPTRLYQQAIEEDAAVKAKKGRVGIGVIVRDYLGHVVGTIRAQRPLKGTPFDVEAYGLVVAAVLYKVLGLQQICLERDAKRVVDVLQSKALDWSLGGA
ncbi:uncharacterized protein LOC122312604 [Carya illinoinensis]|uniref:uncharacterized protein LOC122312604 n=1 Tax=Carya illinoinensis TaxID=32201 RepID=UPI001C724648|nr:uncharacterized protein LOC122312604 [Carya illinoinensis]